MGRGTGSAAEYCRLHPCTKMTTHSKVDYACGLYVQSCQRPPMIEHDGNNIGFNSDMAYYPEDEDYRYRWQILMALLPAR